MSSLEDISLALFVVGLLVSVLLVLLNEYILAAIVLTGVVILAFANVMFRYVLKPSAPFDERESQQSRRRRRLSVTTANTNEILKLGVIGFSNDNFNVDEASSLLRDLFIDLGESTKKRLIVVANWTAVGVPLIAYREARILGLQTVGFACKQARTQEKSLFDADEVYIVGKTFGDEVASFLTFIDGLVLVGDTTLIRESAMFREFKGPKWKFDHLGGDAV